MYSIIILYYILLLFYIVKSKYYLCLYFSGKMVFRSEAVFRHVKSRSLVPIHYVDDSGEATSVYPFNPNGSPEGIAALCSEDGRHLAIMPHPERCFLPWQCQWMPKEYLGKLEFSPWMKMFQNAFEWCQRKD